MALPVIDADPMVEADDPLVALTARPRTFTAAAPPVRAAQTVPPPPPSVPRDAAVVMSPVQGGDGPAGARTLWVPGQPATVLHGRTREAEVLYRQVWNLMNGERAEPIFVVGPDGSGRWSLVHSALRTAQEQKLPVLYVVTDDGQAPTTSMRFALVEYAFPWLKRQLMKSKISAGTPSVAPVSAAVELSGEDRVAPSTELANLLHLAAKRQRDLGSPLVIGARNLELADSQVRDGLFQGLKRLQDDQVPVGLFVSGSPGASYHRLTGPNGVRIQEIALGPLPEAAVRDLLAAPSGSDAELGDAAVDVIVARSGGLPGLATQYAAYIRDNSPAGPVAAGDAVRLIGEADRAFYDRPHRSLWAHLGRGGNTVQQAVLAAVARRRLPRRHFADDDGVRQVAIDGLIDDGLLEDRAGELVIPSPALRRWILDHPLQRT